MASVFLSYRQENLAHTQQVRALAERLESNGITVVLDQLAVERDFYGGCPPRGWPMWSIQMATNASSVLIIGSAGWFKVINDPAPTMDGKGAAAEATVVVTRLYKTSGYNDFAAIGYTDSAGDLTTLPPFLHPLPRFNFADDAEYERLLRWLRRPLTVPSQPDLPAASDEDKTVGPPSKVLPSGLATTSSLSAALVQSRPWGIVGCGLVTIFALVLLALVFAQSPVGRFVEQSLHFLLQRELAASALAVPARVVVVDISDIPDAGKADDDPDGTPVTSRQHLLETVQAVLRYNPTAIGIDVDFSMMEGDANRPGGERGRLVTAGDREFLRTLQKLSRQYEVPIFVGVWATEALPEADWLAGVEFKDLAAAVQATNLPQIPDRNWNAGQGLDLRWGFRSLKSDRAGEPLPSMGTRLALRPKSATGGDTRAGDDRGLGWWRWFLSEKQEVQISGHLRGSVALVDYRPLDALQQEAITSSEPTQIDREAEKIRNRAVLLGIVAVPARHDNFVIPGRPTPVAGVFLHACAAVTFSYPALCELTLLGRMLLDAALAISILTLVFCTCRFLSRPLEKADPKVRLIHNFVTITAFLLVLSFGSFFVTWQRVLWLDFLAVALVLLIQSPAEHSIFRLGPRLCRWFARRNSHS